MRAKALERAMALVPLAPVIKLPSQIADLLPQQTRSPLTTSRVELHYRRGDFYYPRVKVDRAACG